MKKPFLHFGQKRKQAAAKARTVKANYTDDVMAYCCDSLIAACTDALRELDGENEAIAQVLSETIVCATVCAAHFRYYDQSSLAERIAACTELCQCCDQLSEALAEADFDGANAVLECAQSCCQQCALTAGANENETQEETQTEAAQVSAPAVVGKSRALLKPLAYINKKTRQPWLIVAEASDGNVEMSINGLIGASVLDDSGVSGKEFTDALSKIPKGKHINLRINSEGGSVPDGLEIYNRLKERRPDVTCYVDGVALSCASLIALAAEHVVSPLSSVWMIHTPRMLTYGDTDDHKQSINMLKSYTDMMADVYASETGHDKDEILSLMEAESWFTGSEAVEYGLATTTGEQDEQEEKAAGAEAVKRPLVYAHAALSRFNPPDKIKSLLSATAKGSGVTGTAAGNPQPAQPMNKETTVTTAAGNSTADIATLQASLEKERKARVTAEVKRRAENKIANDKLSWWVDLALKDEDSVYAQIESLPEQHPGGAPIGQSGGRIELVEGRYEQIKKLPTPMARLDALRADWVPLMADADARDRRARRSNPLAANTFSATLTTDMLELQAITQLQNRWAALSCFTRDFTTDPYKPLATVQVPLVTAGATALVGSKGSGISNFESGDSTVTNVAVTVNHYSVPFHMTQDELMSGLRIEQLATINLAVLADTVIQNVISNIATSTFTAGTHFTPMTGNGTFWANDMPVLWSFLKKSPIKNLILDGTPMSKLINQPGFFQPALAGDRDSSRAKTFGWDNIELNTQWSTAPANVNGFACNPQAICVAAGLPMVPPMIPGGTLEQSSISIPGPDINIATYMWFSLATRTLWCSYDVMFGSKAGDLTAGAVLINGNGPT